MKIIIEHGETKRQINGPFNICGSRDDIYHIVAELSRHLNDSTWSYGWTYIVDRRQPSIANTPPIGWEP
jgi:hypothetical protein